MYIWGEGSSGQLGQGKFNKFKSARPLVLDTLENEQIVACAWYALATDKNLLCVEEIMVADDRSLVVMLGGAVAGHTRRQ